MASTVPAYTDYAEEHLGDDDFSVHLISVLSRVAHRTICPGCFESLCGGSTEPDDMDRALDAQLDILIAAYGGDVRITLACTVQALGRAAKLVGALSRMPPEPHS